MYHTPMRMDIDLDIKNAYDTLARESIRIQDGTCPYEWIYLDIYNALKRESIRIQDIIVVYFFCFFRYTR